MALHWLPVPQWIQLKIAALAFDCVRGTGPAYFSHVHAKFRQIVSERLQSTSLSLYTDSAENHGTERIIGQKTTELNSSLASSA